MNRDAGKMLCIFYTEAAYMEICLNLVIASSLQGRMLPLFFTHDLRGGLKQVGDSYQHVRYQVADINYKS